MDRGYLLISNLIKVGKHEEYSLYDCVGRSGYSCACDWLYLSNPNRGPSVALARWAAFIYVYRLHFSCCQCRCVLDRMDRRIRCASRWLAQYLCHRGDYINLLFLTCFAG